MVGGQVVVGIYVEILYEKKKRPCLSNEKYNNKCKHSRLSNSENKIIWRKRNKYYRLPVFKIERLVARSFFLLSWFVVDVYRVCV